MNCIRCRVTGRVQGVWFRAGTRRQAIALGITGYARNRPGGAVEVLACGDEAAVARLKGWLWQGTPGARVDKVVCEAVEQRPPRDFEIG